ncbi:type VI secretion system ImpA family protein [Azospirillum fermentarium]|uniref:type VI secretion system protein TssA n=1 Tax=Azospirillum fermentarium TaxID=1233114 RepID=UPI0022266723|nr:type VI secretion system protein TssA [Azospirillum fermentarium]MCW2249426.1 type VI secretion system ImpA family protein [Azospirillum fermentarium]
MDAQPATAEPQDYRPRIAALPYAALIKPISPDAPCGESLRYDDAYDRLREYQREEDAGLSQDVWQREVKRAQWPDLYRLAVDVLRSRTKDLQIGCWLTEALAHLHGIPGIIDGLNLLGDYGALYWADVHPEVEDGDLEWRAAPFVALDRRLVVFLRQVPLTSPATADASPCSLDQYDETIQMEALSRRNAKQFERLASEGKMTRQRMLASASLTPMDFFVAQARELAGLLAEVAKLEGRLEALMGRDAPSFTGTRGVLDNMVRVIKEIGGMNDIPTDAAPDAAAVAGAEDPAVDARGASVSEFPNRPAGPIVSREDAYRRLTEAADYLLRTEPHSPVPYLIKRAVAWGRMDLSELLQELMSNDQDLFKTYGLLGIREWTGRK